MRHRVVLLALVVCLAMTTSAALAGSSKGKGGGKRTGLLDLVMMDGKTELARGGNITFDVKTSATDWPFVGLRCWQGSTWMYDAYVGYFPESLSRQWFVLDSPYWTDGVRADCTARLFYFNTRGGEILLKELDFMVA